MVINLIKIKSMSTAARQKHQLPRLPLSLVLGEAKIDQVLEHHLLGITTYPKTILGTQILICAKQS